MVGKLVRRAERVARQPWPRWLARFRPIVSEFALAIVNQERIPIANRVRCWIHGFYADKNLLYDFDTYSPTDYVSDYARNVRTDRINEPYKYLIGDKWVAPLILHGLGGPVPHTYAVTQDRRLVFAGTESDAAGGKLSKLLARQKRLIVKPRMGSGGQGVFRLEWTPEGATVNGEPVDDIDRWVVPDGSIVCEHVIQHPYAETIFPGTVNTLRVITMWDYDRGEPFVAFASHRFGTNRSGAVDNYGAGGIATGVDIESGVLGRCSMVGDDRRPVDTPVHPETGVQISGLQIPHWETTCRELVRLTASLPGIHYIGWDIVITPDGFTIIEGNNRSDVVMQMFGPFLIDPRIRRFYERHGVVARQPGQDPEGSTP